MKLSNEKLMESKILSTFKIQELSLYTILLSTMKMSLKSTVINYSNLASTSSNCSKRAIKF